MRVKDSVFVITGGASGLGEACVRHFVSLGGKAAIFDVAADKGPKLAAEMGPAAAFFQTDVTSEQSVASAIDQTMKTFGAIHVAVNCAGIGTPAKVLGKKGPMSLEHFTRVVNLNLVGTMIVIIKAAEKMALNPPNDEGEKGLIINTASAAAFEGQIGQAAYSASKAGVVGLTLPVAREFADYGLRVVTIAPGLFYTPMLMGLPEEAIKALAATVPFPKRLGRPHEFALLAEQIVVNPMLNGETIRLDGAIRMAAK
ncbi:MAG: SDR family NAD(P)-dependent oxidoreductase [Thermodesulfobacteriota bacterium]